MDYLLISKIVQVVVTILLTSLILLQSKGKGLVSGVGSYISMYRSRRGLEQAVFIFTTVLATVLVVNSIILITLN